MQQTPPAPTLLPAAPPWSAAAALDALLVLKIVEAKTHQRGCELLARIVAMLTRLCR